MLISLFIFIFLSKKISKQKKYLSIRNASDDPISIGGLNHIKWNMNNNSILPGIQKERNRSNDYKCPFSFWDRRNARFITSCNLTKFDYYLYSTVQYSLQAIYLMSTTCTFSNVQFNLHVTFWDNRWWTIDELMIY